ncbi:lysylphosphatidylglycerol synthase transmembrane domain-containing protein [Halomicrobium salinisoli]|uniref:lysylphosphatidylglycerol synthase transmembrane domain-containing protein n=1 Tax=Halomicrobium salinisoli TaxID=2878391 RepID=UPI001CF03A2A|nr:lysylphosphatidylglycerol synthase domain-containing protein [Halomicrobium salinisoli]
MRRILRFLVGVGAGGAILAGYLYTVGAETVLDRLVAVTPWALALVALLVVLEGLADAIGVWASIAPLNDGISPGESVKFALAGDFFDTLSPAGPVSSEPIMARFFSVATDTGYSEALGVRSTAKYVKAGTQACFSAILGLFVLVGSPDATPILATFGLSIGGLVVFGGAVLRFRASISKGLVAVLTPIVTLLSGLYRDQPYDRAFVAAGVDRYWRRIVGFQERPRLLALIGVGGLVEQTLTATALWVALAGVGAESVFLPILIVVPLPQLASVVPIPGSLGAYDLLLGGALVVAAGVPTAVATAAVLVVRTLSLPFSGIAGGICVAHLRGWRPGGRSQ